MRRRVATRWAVAAASAVLGLSGVSAGSAMAAGGLLTPTAERAFTELSGCIAGEDSREVAALFLVDESGSLKYNDPKKERVNALRSATSSLADLSAQLRAADKNVVAMGSTFGERYTRRQPWTTVSPKGHELDAFISKVGDLNNSQGTNYVAALAGARDAFRERQDACKVLYWFTDGKLDMKFDGASMTDGEAWNAMAKPQGLIDGLRSQGVTVIALPLFSNDSPAKLRVTAQDRSKLKALAEGVGSDGGSHASAGRLDSGTIPESYVAGAYLESADPSVLSRYFSYAVARSSGFTDAGQLRCPSSPKCPAGRLQVLVEPGITRSQVLLVSDATPGPLTLLGPKGEVVLSSDPGKAASGSLLDARARITWSGRLAKLDVVTAPSSSANGRWTLVTDPKRESTATLLLQSGLHVALPKDRPPLIAGEPTTFDLSVSYADGTPVDPKVFRQFAMTAGLDGNLAPTVAKAPSVYQTTVKADGQSAQTTLSTAVAVTSAAGITLDPLTPSFTLRVSPPDGFPRVESMTFPEVQGDEPVTGKLTVAGASDAATSVTIGAPALTSPDGSVATALALQGVETGKPIALAAGERREIQVVFTPSAAVDGVASGSVPVTLDSNQGGQPTLTQRVPFEIAMVRPVDQGQRALWVAAFAAASLLIPVLLLYVVAFFLARFRLPTALFYLRRYAVVMPDGSLRGQDGEPISASPHEWASVRDRTRRMVEVPDLRLRAGVRGLSPRTWAECAGAGVDIAAGDAPYLLAGRRGRGPASPNPHGTLYLLVTDSALRPLRADPDAEVAVTVIAFTDINAADGSIEQANARLQAWSRGRDAVALLLDRLPSIAEPSGRNNKDTGSSASEKQDATDEAPPTPFDAIAGSSTQDLDRRPVPLFEDADDGRTSSSASAFSSTRSRSRGPARADERGPSSLQPPELL